MLTLGISTSLGQSTVLLGDAQEIKYHSEGSQVSDPRDITLLLKEGLKHLDVSLDDIKNIIIDNGPGGTNSVRRGVALANSLAFTLGLNLCPVSSLELVALEAWHTHQVPVVSTVKSLKGQAFIGVSKKEGDSQIFYGKIKDILPDLIEGIEEFCVTGYHRTQIKELFPNKKVQDTGLEHGSAELLLKNHDLFLKRGFQYPRIIIPITEQYLKYG